ncbi:MAG: YdiU family protein [Massilia sp.]|nr:YdiU family protein [Massilia sp.]
MARRKLDDAGDEQGLVHHLSDHRTHRVRRHQGSCDLHGNCIAESHDRSKTVNPFRCCGAPSGAQVLLHAPIVACAPDRNRVRPHPNQRSTVKYQNCFTARRCIAHHPPPIIVTGTAITADDLPLSNSFAALPPTFYTRLMPTPLPAPYFVAASAKAGTLVGLTPEQLASDDFVELLTGNRVATRSQPLAAVYSGHQFGVWAGQLGDGRAILLGELNGSAGPMELQLKGAGLTPYSRMGDGRAVLRSSVREFLCSEAMHALGIPSTRALCITGSDQGVLRETVETSSVVTRMAPSFVRFGSFEHWYHRDKPEQLRVLADYVINTFYPELTAEPNPYTALLAEVSRRTARMIAHWQGVGFMHGVMNTDNMSILGLTLDYGPFGFMEAFDPGHICNHTDQQGRYSYANQPQVGHWNCYALGQALLPLIGDVDAAEEALGVYQPAFSNTLEQLLHAKLGLLSVQEQDPALLDDLFKLMQAGQVDFTRFFRALGNLVVEVGVGDGGPGHQAPHADSALRDMFIDRSGFDHWALRYRQRLRFEHSIDGERKVAMDRANPKYVLRNYLAQVAIDKAKMQDYSEIARLLSVLEHPFDEQPENEAYAALPPDWASHLEVSCSS